MREPRPLIPVVPLAFILPGPLFQPEQRASDADRDTAVDILCAAVAEGRLTLAELDKRAGAALSARTICELAALIADLSGPWTPVPASASVRVPPPAAPGWASRAPERWSLLQSLAGRPVLPGQLVPVSLSRSAAHRDKVQQRGDMPVRTSKDTIPPGRQPVRIASSSGPGSGKYSTPWQHRIESRWRAPVGCRPWGITFAGLRHGCGGGLHPAAGCAAWLS